MTVTDPKSQMDHYLITGGQIYRIPLGDEDIDEYLGWLATDRGVADSPPVFLSRQEVVTRTGRSAASTEFPKEAVIVGNPNRTSGVTRGWLEPAVDAWMHDQLIHDDEPAAAVATDGGQEEPADDGCWPPGSIQWTDVPPTAADGLIALATAQGIIRPAGRVIDSPLAKGTDLGAFVRGEWPNRLRDIPQVWLFPEALERIGFPLEIEIPEGEHLDLRPLVEETFGCRTELGRAGWFTCLFPAADDADGPVKPIKVHLVLVPFLNLDPADNRPGDMGLARIGDDSTEIPDDETEAAHVIADRIAWIANLGTGVLPSMRWPNVGLRLLDSIRARGRRLDPPLVPCPLPTEIAPGTRIDPDLAKFSKGVRRPHRAKVGTIEVEVDQRRAYLASAGQVYLGYGKPSMLERPNPAVFDEVRPPFGLWHIQVPAAKDCDGLSTRLPLPQEDMSWDAPVRLWMSTRGVQLLTAPVEQGGAGIAPIELDLLAAWVWPEQSRLLKTWTDSLRAADREAIAEGRTDRSNMVKAIYTSYIGKMHSRITSENQRVHEQPAFAATIRADVRARALKYARAIADEHGWYPIWADVDAWRYRLPETEDPATLEEDSEYNGKYRIKKIERY